MDADDWNARYAATDELVWRADPNQFLPPEVEELTPGRALDLACGEGRNAVWLARQGWTATGVDWAQAGLDKAARLAAEHGVEVEWVTADLLGWEPDGTYDLVAVFYLQVPAAELRDVLGRAVRAAAAGGTVLVVGHDLRNLTEGVGGPQDPAVLSTPDDVVAHLMAAGRDDLVVEKAERVTRAVGDDTAIDYLVRVRRP